MPGVLGCPPRSWASIVARCAADSPLALANFHARHTLMNQCQCRPEPASLASGSPQAEQPHHLLASHVPVLYAPITRHIEMAELENRYTQPTLSHPPSSRHQAMATKTAANRASATPQEAGITGVRESKGGSHCFWCDTLIPCGWPMVERTWRHPGGSYSRNNGASTGYCPPRIVPEHWYA